MTFISSPACNFKFLQGFLPHLAQQQLVWLIMLCIIINSDLIVGEGH